jgi:hypothetical protein
VFNLESNRMDSNRGFTSKSSVIWLPIALAASFLIWRVAKLGFGVPDFLPNFSPWLALAFAGTALAPRTLKWWIWPSLLVGCDLFFARGDISGMWSVYGMCALTALAAVKLRGSLGAAGLVSGTLLSTLVFYSVSSTQAWWVNPVYASTFSGWLQALTIGDPAYQPQAWVFGVRSLLSEGLFATLLVLAYNVEAAWKKLAQLPWLHSRPIEA